MPFSHHSHSGQFCGHAKDSLEECVVQAISKGLRVFALTEHMPRDQVRDLYAEEIEAGITPEALSKLFDDFHHTALNLREKYKHQITLLIGFEIDYIRPESLTLISSLRSKYQHDLIVGSVHHVNTVPIDFSKGLFADAKRSAGGGEEALFEQYFDDQYTMLTALKPQVVGHFDLIRLLCSDHTIDFRQFKLVWDKIERNVKFIAQYGGLVEFNSAALRKGWKTPYPGRDVAELMVQHNIKFTLSDDSHGTAQIAYAFDEALAYAKDLGLDKIYYYHWKGLERDILTGKLVVADGVQVKLPEVGDVEVLEHWLL